MSPQKLFIHFDKQNYAAGETIWLKGYLIDGSNHTLHAATANIYLELWNAQGEMIRELIFQPSEGIFHGHIFIDPDIPDGNYAIRAYTDWMLNQGEPFLFYHYFYIKNPAFANSIDNDTRRFNREFNSMLEALGQEIKVEFFPEGGKLISELESRVAIRIVDGTGKGIKAKGLVKDESGLTITEFETNEAGLGLFNLKPKPGQQYQSEINAGGRKPVMANLTQVYSEGYTLRADIVNGLLEISLSRAGLTSPSSKSILLAHSGGELVYLKPDIELEEPQKIRIPLKELPSGISHFSLFSADKEPVAERLVFVNHDDQLYFDIRAQLLREAEVNALNIDVLASDEEGNPIAGNFSVSVQYGDVGHRTHYENIFSYFLLSSDLEGPQPNPALYFDYSQDNVEAMVDLLMLTNSWKRFSWSEIFNEEEPEISFSPVNGITVSGSLTGRQKFSGIANAEVKMRLVEDHSVSSQAKTDASGNFLFNDLSLADSVLIEIIPPMIEGRQTPEVSLNPSGRALSGAAPLAYNPNVSTLPQQITERGSNWSRPRAERSAQSPSRGGQLFGSPDQTIYVNDNEPYSEVIDVLRDKAVGLSISPSGFITIRGPSSIMYQSPPLFFVDGIESEGAFFGTHPRDIERIEIFRGASTAAFGARGASGALAAYTKRRDYQSEISSSNIFYVSGWHVPRQFNLDIDESLAFEALNTVKTAFWEPQLVAGEDGTASFRFVPLPGVTQYRIVIQGVGTNGKIGYAEFVIGN